MCIKPHAKARPPTTHRLQTPVLTILFFGSSWHPCARTVIVVAPKNIRRHTTTLFTSDATHKQQSSTPVVFIQHWQEIQQLMGNYQSLRVAQSQFGMSKESIVGFKESPEGAEMLIPLTEALYVPATIASNKKVLVEYGAGYYVERNCNDAEGFFNRKVKFLSERTEQLETTIRQKREQLAQVIQIYQMKVKMAAEENANR